MSRETQIPEVGDFIIICGNANDLQKFYGDKRRVAKVHNGSFFEKGSISAIGSEKGRFLLLAESEFYIV